MGRFTAATLILLSLGSSVSCMESQPKTYSEGNSQASFAPDRIIFKLKSGFELASVQELLDRYQVVSAEPLFAGSMDAEAIKAKFPERAKRAPAGAVMPDLSGTYVIHLPPGSDIQAVVADFSKHSAVAYAQPDYIATIQ